MAEQQTPTTSTATDKTQLPRQLRPFTGNTVKVLLDWLHSFDKQTDKYNWLEEKKKDHILALMDEKNEIKMSNQLGTSDREEDWKHWKEQMVEAMDDWTTPEDAITELGKLQ